ncbi:MAG: glycosyltransferase [Candidatus Riflebacteria bacterium]|nr:glycosyltransferase [Candidatus Riflebacteria bacterium]
MKLLALVSALDLRYRLSSTPHWWQLLKGLSRQGADVIAVPYHGPAVESLHWRVYENPCRLEGETFYQLRGLVRRVLPAPSGRPRDAHTAERLSDNLVRRLAHAYVQPRWSRAVRNIFRKEKGIGAVIVFNLPLNHVVGLAREIQTRFGVPVWYYDGDLPASFPEFGGFATGFRTHEGTNFAEYDGFFVNSEGSIPRMRELGARRVEAVHWGADLDVYRPLEREQDLDAFFYGYGEQYRERWLEAMIYGPSRKLDRAVFAIGGLGLGSAPDSVRQLGDVPFSRFNEMCARAKVNLIVTRQAHASVPGSSSARPFELGAMGVAAVTNPWAGVERWFEPGKEILIVNDEDEAMACYGELWADPGRRKALGQAMRRRVERDHTYEHRAGQILDLLGLPHRKGP